MTTHSNILAWEISRTEEPNRLQSMGSQRGRHGWECTHTSCYSHYATYTDLSCPQTLSVVPTRHIWNLLTYDATIPLLGIYPDKTKIWKDTCTWMFITALFTVAKTRKHPQFSSVTQSCPTLHDPMDHYMPGLPVHHQLPESTQTHLHWDSDAIRQSHPLSSPSPPAFYLSQHQSFPMSQLFKSGGQSIGVSTSISVLAMNTKDWYLGWTDWISLQSKGLSRVFSNTTVQKHQFSSTQIS